MYASVKFGLQRRFPFGFKTDTKKATIPVLKTALNLDKKKFLRRLLTQNQRCMNPKHKRGYTESFKNGYFNSYHDTRFKCLEK